MNESKLTFRKTIIIASLIFGMLFGAGNLIFPVHLGQLAGKNWLLASSGFLISGVLIPLMSLLAISITRSNGIYDLAKPIGKRYALIFLILIHATLGPLFATPRTATVPFTIGFANHIPSHLQGIGLLIFSAVFFGIVYFLSATEAKITNLIGKILNPVFLIMLFVIFLLAFINPIGSSNTAVTAAYVHNSFTNGFLEGYNTMDCLAALAFGITVITAIKGLGIKKSKEVSIATAKSGFIGILGVALIYICLIWLGATSLNSFKLSSNGGTALAQIAHYYLGTIGDALLATLTTVTCLTTAMGLVVAFAQDFHREFPKISYKKFLAFNCFLSFIIANLGLDQIIAWSTPVLMLLYPLAISLVILGILSPLFKNDPIVYKVTTALTLIPALFDMINSTPDMLKNTQFMQAIVSFAEKYIPLFNLGFGWLMFSILGLVIGLIIHFVRSEKSLKTIED
ncbi:branched-chain amino acid transport system II carrier protein [Lactobacillus kalixensis]|nr:branched-chain amino acid transport system II carrier protein [Lactobacillus kalixensis]